MKTETDGIVIREQIVRESDKVVTILTRDKGLLTAYAAGAKNIKNPKSTATGLLTYSAFVLYQGRERFVVDEANAKEVFMGLRRDVVSLALAQYFCELAAAVVPEGEKSEEQLRLMLNSLYLLSKGSRPAAFVKAVFELRLTALSGFMPDLVCCSSCACYEHDRMRFFPESGTLLCGDCSGENPKKGIVTGQGATMAMRHCIYSEFNKLFSFTVSENALQILEQAAEEYTLSKLERKFRTLDFYKQVRT